MKNLAEKNCTVILSYWAGTANIENQLSLFSGNANMRKKRNKKGTTLSSLEDEILTQLIVFLRNHSRNNNTTAGMLEICNVCSLRNKSCYFITKISNKGKVYLFLLINLSSAVSCPNDQLIFVVISRYQLLMEKLYRSTIQFYFKHFWKLLCLNKMY